MAYIVKYPNTKTNQNEYEIRVRSTARLAGIDNGHLIASYHEEASSLRWLRDSRHLDVLLGKDETIRRESRIVELDSATGSSKVVVSDSEGITEYSVSADGRTVAFLAALKPTSSDSPLLDKRLLSRGFSVPSNFTNKMFEKRGSVRTGRLALWIARKNRPDRTWGKEAIRPPMDALEEGREHSGFGLALNLSMAPNGRYLAFVYQMRHPSDKWMRNRTVRAYLDDFGVMPQGLGLYDVILHKFIDVPATPFPHLTWWSEDSQAYASLSSAPIGSKWEAEDTLKSTEPRGNESFHVFSVNLNTLTASEVLTASQAKGDSYSVVSWKRGDGDMLLESERGKKVAELSPTNDEWKEITSHQSLPKFALDPIRRIGDDRFIGVHQSSTQPPDLWYIDESKNDAAIQLTSLNPSAREFSLGHLDDIQWKNGYGVTVSGKLLTPPNFDRTTQYPLVVMLTWPNEEFVCDGHYSTAFAPQPLASAGFAVAMFNVYDAFGKGQNQPVGPPQTKEAESTLSSVESLVSYLGDKGIIQKDNVGIVGFSRSSWKVDYFITHSRMRLSAASSADGGLGNYGRTWIDGYGDWAKEMENGYGGSFWTSDRSAWLDGAPAFNADKVSTPLLMEYTGAEGLIDQPYAAYEFHSALKSLEKPVDLFFYPLGSHPLDTPFERVASLQRNVDWFRFWMQGYEGKSPDYDPDQYKRWKHLRELRDADAKAATRSQKNAANPN